MLQGATTSVTQPPSSSLHLIPRRIRHITAIQVRNLTPFPVRDAFTSALSQPVEQPHFVGVNDDLGAIISRRRSRKISTNSTATRRNLKWDDGKLDVEPPVASEERGRTVSASKVTFSGSGLSTSPGLGQSFTSSRSTHSLRSYRARTNSMASSNSNHAPGSSLSVGTSGSVNPGVAPLLPDNSQVSLEKILGSRLVETFITITFLDTPLPTGESSRWASPSPSSASSSGTSLASERKNKTSSTSTSPRPPSKNVPGASPSKARFSSSQKPTVPRGTMSDPRSNVVVRLNGSAKTSSTITNKKGKLPATLSFQLEPGPNQQALLPSYFSPIHRPSTNPLFPIDPPFGRDFPECHDTSGQRLKVEIWGKLVHQKHVDSECVKDEWKLLDEWKFELGQLLPLSDDLGGNSSQLPSNAIVITLSSPGQNFYLPSTTNHSSRAPSPSVGYISDPESDVRRQIHEPSAEIAHDQPMEHVPMPRRRRHGATPHTGTSDVLRTTGWQELFKLVNLQSLILDNESSLNDIVGKIECHLKEDETFVLRRQISEREAQLETLRHNHRSIMEQCEKEKHGIAARLERLRSRAVSLGSARETLAAEQDLHAEVDFARSQLSDVQHRATFIRTSILSTLSSIFPIEIYSPSDLLFTILDIPLPIPLGANDPAPPLSLPEFKEVTEESVATALGYSAQVLHMLTAYTGKNLIYPVICIGSRSLIRDGISSMVGPRMFPLFSRGVDTYRFEYGVFLLNKDIEMLMSERDLRALDLRHTLPNLKNLLLTLSHDTSIAVDLPRRSPSPPGPPSGLETPPREPSPTKHGINTPNTSENSRSGDVVTPTASGSTTPTVLDDSRRIKPFLGFVAIPDFLRSRYPSSSHPEKGVQLVPQEGNDASTQDEDLHHQSDSDGGNDINEEDRMTVHGSVHETNTDEGSSTT